MTYRKYYIGSSAIARFFVALLIFGSTVSCRNEVPYQEELYEIAVKINAKCPQMIDSETRLDGIEIKEPVTLVYKYTLVNLMRENVDTAAFRRALWPGLVSNIKISSDMKKLRDNETIVHYAYSDKSNKPILTVTITPNDYK